jgi:hypothetical protein
MVEAHGSIGQLMDGNVGELATDSAAEQSLEVGWHAEETGARRLRLVRGTAVSWNSEREVGHGDVTGAVVEGNTSKGQAPLGKSETEG